MKLYKFNPHKLTLEQIDYKHYLWATLIVFILFSSVGFTSAIRFNSIIEKIPIIIRPNEDKFSEENLRKEIRRLNIKFEDILIQQYKLETYYGTSLVFKQNHNLFGLKVATQRPTTAIGENLNHASYTDWKASVIDMALWQIQNARGIKDENEYYQLLDGMYAEVDNYSERLKNTK
jgi:hypothetical protein